MGGAKLCRDGWHCREGSFAFWQALCNAGGALLSWPVLEAFDVSVHRQWWGWDSDTVTRRAGMGTVLESQTSLPASVSHPASHLFLVKVS
jgi:hypothetical protein